MLLYKDKRGKKMFKKDEKLETLRELLGTRESYLETVKTLELKDNEKEILLRASVELKKRKPSSEIIDKAYNILVSKSFPNEKIEVDKDKTIEMKTNNISFKKEKSIALDWKKVFLFIIILPLTIYIVVSMYKFAPELGGFFAKSSEVVIEKNTVKRNGLRYKVNSQEPFTGVIVSYYHDGQKEYEKEYKNGIVDGKVIEYYISGQKKYEGYLKNNVEDRKIITWYANGQKRYEKNYKNGVLNGKVVSWNRSGQKEYEKEYKDGVLHGKTIEWHYDKDGFYSIEHFYINNIEDNSKKVVREYYKSGEKRLEGFVISITPTSRLTKITQWYKNGQKKYEGKFKNGKPNDIFIAWDEKGNVIAEADTKIDDVVSVDDGKLEYIYNTENNMANGRYVKWYSSGSKMEEGNYNNDKADGKFITWYKNKQKKREVFYVDGTLEGKFTEWYENGQKKRVGHYHNDKLDGKVIEYYKDGKKKSEENYVNGQLEGKALYWDKSDIEPKEKIYKNGISLEELERKRKQVEEEKIRRKKEQKLRIERQSKALQAKLEQEHLQKRREKELMREKKEREKLLKKKEEAEHIARGKGCYYLDNTLQIGTIEGYVTGDEDGNLIFEKKYLINMPNRYYSFIKRRKVSIVVRKTGKTQPVPLISIYPYEPQEGESEYSKRAINHKRRFPANKFKNLEVFNFVGFWKEVCK